MKKDYDSTVARIAGNILSGMLNPVTLQSVAKEGVKSGMHETVQGALRFARLLVEETQRTEKEK